ncbi:hypothetical protein SKAU_G00141410 [Synaphobranchus kaupii]|uniref:Uncharacterized protein n=1 Tax=Synaphobranchus kaupii TaxID=118154 RepID=A0A9Q1FT88_SYNKA|nr:hypothetical protein SKAU_G00141410 [Synaphobranchus kaupii]
MSFSDFQDSGLVTVKDLQSASSLGQFMGKLCPHHKRQIVGALGFLQTELKTAASSGSPQRAAFSRPSQVPGEVDCGPVSWLKDAEASSLSVEQRASFAHKSMGGPQEAPRKKTYKTDSVPVSATPVSEATGKALLHQACSECLDIRPVDGKSWKSFLLKDTEGRENARLGNLAPSSRKDLSFYTRGEYGSLSERVTNSNYAPVDTLEKGYCSFKTLWHPIGVEQGPVDLRNSQSKVLSNRSTSHKKSTKRVSSEMAGRSGMGSYPPLRDSSRCQTSNDPDGQFDVVYISKPLTECKVQPKKTVPSRCNARKSIRGHVYIHEYLELKTVRTLAGRPCDILDEGNCPSLVPETITLVTPKQALAKPDSIPVADIPFSGGLGQETLCQEGQMNKHAEGETAGDVATGIMETSNTGQPLIEEASAHPSQNESCTEEAFAQNCMNQGIPDCMSMDENLGEKTDKGASGLMLREDGPSAVTVKAQDNSLVANGIDIKDLASEITPEGWDKHIGYKPKLSPSAPSAAAEDCIEGASSEPDSLDQHPPPDAQSRESSMEKEALGEDEENILNDSITGQQISSLDPACRLAGGPVSSEEKQMVVAEVSIEKSGKSVEEQSPAMDLNLQCCDSGNSGNNTTETAKRSSSKNVAPSDRCLRPKSQAHISEPTRVPSVVRRTSSLSPEHLAGLIKNPGYKCLQRGGSMTIETDNDRKMAPQSPEVIVCKQQTPSEVKPQDAKVPEIMVRTRQNYKMAMELGMKRSSSGSQVLTPIANPSTENGQNAPEISVRIYSQKEEKVLPSARNEGSKNDISSCSVENSSKRSSRMTLRGDGIRTAIPQSSAAIMKHERLLKLQGSAKSLTDSAEGKTEESHADYVEPGASRSVLCHNGEMECFGFHSLDLTMLHQPKFVKALKVDEHQQLITNLDAKYNQMKNSWVQTGKEGQAAPRSKNKADRLKEIWKSKRRVCKPRLPDRQKGSLVQQLFTKTFHLPSVCHWFLQTTETKSIVIVKKANTRLPSETQLCFHSYSGLAGSSREVFPSLQAERLKKHLKKFAGASPIKSNPRNQQLIAIVREQGDTLSKGSENVELTTATRISTKPNRSHPPDPQMQAASSKHIAADANLPATTHLLRKYSNSQEKLLVQQHKHELEEIVFQDLESAGIKPCIPLKLISKSQKIASNSPEKCKNTISTTIKGRKTIPTASEKGKKIISRAPNKDQVITRSQRKMEVMSSGSIATKTARKRPQALTSNPQAAKRPRR